MAFIYEKLNMGNEADYIEIVKKAKLGDEKSLNCLAELARERLCAYVFRITLDSEETKDIVQESVLEMVKIFGKLKDADRFWPWLYRIALNKIHRSRRDKKRHKTINKSKILNLQNQQKEGLEELITEELKQIISTAMHTLRPNQRAIIAMRCYDEMSYSEIAEAMGRSEFSCRMMFYRAKKSLEKQLSRRGLGKGALLTALVVFGRLTAPNKATAASLSVTTAGVKSGICTILAASAISKTGLVSLLTIGALTAGTISVINKPEQNYISINPNEGNAVSFRCPVNEEADEYWYYFPKGDDGPVMILTKAHKNESVPYCIARQNESGNYYFDKSRNTIYIENHRMWQSDLSVWRIPTDNEGLSEFLTLIEGNKPQIKYVQSSDDGLLVIHETGKYTENRPQIIYHYNVLEEEYFRYNLPKSAKVIDNRDRMHQRGWTYFRISGELNGEKVKGSGRIPFVYAASEENQPWMRLQIGGKEFIDNSFTGFARPWMGLHTIDAIRRDAAKQKIRFETKISIPTAKAKVELTDGQNKVTYYIDMKKDLIEKITYTTNNGTVIAGELIFTYLQEVEKTGGEFVGWKGQAHRRPLLWEIMELAD